MVWCCGLFGEGLLVGGGLEEGFWGGLGELGRVVWEGLRYERGERGEGRGERGDGSWEEWLRKEWFGRSGCVDGSGYGRISREQGGAERGVWSEVEILIGVDGYRIHKKKGTKLPKPGKH